MSLLLKRRCRFLIQMLGLVLFAFSPRAHAEYRVFELKITSRTTGQSRNVKSTLDDIQYPTYFPITKDEKIEIADTWMCWNRSDFSQDPAQRFCPSPRAPAAQAAPVPAQ